MLSSGSGSWPQPVVRARVLGQRFQKFLAVGAFGLAVNQVMLFVLHEFLDVRLALASPIAILLSMVVTFALNEMWTWHDRGRGRILHRALFYGAINSGGLAINWLVLILLESEFEVHYLLANLFGAGVAAVWNFGLNHKITWRA